MLLMMEYSQDENVTVVARIQNQKVFSCLPKVTAASRTKRMKRIKPSTLAREMTLLQLISSLIAWCGFETLSAHHGVSHANIANIA